jgi:hypothetical protein
MLKALVTASANQGGRAPSKDQIVDDRIEIKWILTKRVTRRGLDSCSSGQGPLPEQCKCANKSLGWENEGKFMISRSAPTKEFLLIGYLIEHGKRNTGHGANMNVSWQVYKAVFMRLQVLYLQEGNHCDHDIESDDKQGLCTLRLRKEVPYTTPTPHPNPRCHGSPSKALRSIPLQPSSHSIHTNVGSDSLRQR